MDWYWFDLINAAAERWNISMEEVTWGMPYVTLLYRFKSAERFLPKGTLSEDTRNLPDIATLGFEGLEIDNG
jgi:hypothetical protein